jgi:hypothetical protein
MPGKPHTLHLAGQAYPRFHFYDKPTNTQVTAPRRVGTFI